MKKEVVFVSSREELAEKIKEILSQSKDIILYIDDVLKKASASKITSGEYTISLSDSYIGFNKVSMIIKNKGIAIYLKPEKVEKSIFIVFS